MQVEVYVALVLLFIGLVVYLTFRDWIQLPHLSSNAKQKILKAVSQSISLEEWDKAQKELAPLLNSGKRNRQALLFHVQILRGINHLEKAFKVVTRGAREFPEELLFRLEEGKILLKLGRAKEALEAFNVCAPIMRGELDVLALASALFHSGYPGQCLELIETEVQTTHNGELIALTGMALFEQKQFQQAITHYYQAIKKGFKSHQVFIHLGHAYRRLGNLSEAEKIFRTLLEKDASDVAATLGLGACLQERQHYHKALLIYQSGKAWEKKDPLILKQAAMCALRVNKYPFAEHYFREVMQKEKANPQTISYYGYILESQKKWREAETIYLKLIQLFPSHAEGYRALAWLFGVGLTTSLSPEQGTNYAHTALKLKNDPVSWEILSACEARVGNFSKAYQIQSSLALYDMDHKTKIRRQGALRKLRKHLPLDNTSVIRSLVA